MSVDILMDVWDDWTMELYSVTLKRGNKIISIEMTGDELDYAIRCHKQGAEMYYGSGMWKVIDIICYSVFQKS